MWPSNFTSLIEHKTSHLLKNLWNESSSEKLFYEFDYINGSEWLIVIFFWVLLPIRIEGRVRLLPSLKMKLGKILPPRDFVIAIPKS